MNLRLVTFLHIICNVSCQRQQVFTQNKNTTPFQGQIRISQVQIRISQIQIRICQIQIRLPQYQIGLPQYQIRMSQIQIRLKQDQIRIATSRSSTNKTCLTLALQVLLLVVMLQQFADSKAIAVDYMALLPRQSTVCGFSVSYVRVTVVPCSLFRSSPTSVSS